MKTTNKIFAETYNKNFNDVLCFIRTYVNCVDVAQDIATDTFLSLYNNLDKYATKNGTFKPILLTIAKNKVKDYFKLKKDNVNIEDIHISTFGDYDPIVSNETTSHIWKHINRLNERQKQLIILYIEGYSYKEICHMLQIPMGTVTTGISRAKSKLAEYLKDVDMVNI